MEETFIYNGHEIMIKSQEGKRGKTQYWFFIDARPITFADKENTARSTAMGYVDVMNEEDFHEHKTIYIPCARA